MKLLWKAKMSTIQDGGEEVEEGAVYHVTLKRVQIQQAANKGARWLGGEGDQLPPEHTVSQYETCKIRTIKAGTLEKLVENLLTAFGDNDFTYISIFLSTYRAFASAREVLELLLGRYGNLETSSCEEVGSQNSSESKAVLRTAIASILRAWLDQCSEDFREPPDYPCLLKLLDYLKSNIPGSDPERRAQNLLEQFRNQAVEDGFHSPSLCVLYHGEELEVCSPEEFSFFQEDLVAEQLTYMDAQLFKKVVPYHCLGCVWSQRDKKESLAPTIRATISQFNAVTKCVVSTILKNKELKSQQRAKIVEKWIHIAHECRILKNFSSLRAIISALQSNSIYRLKTTWTCVPKDIMLMFEELSDIFSDHDNYLTTRELLMKEGTSKFANLDSSVKENQKRTQRRLQLQKDMGVMQGTVPYLGTFLTDLIMLDTALQDYIEGGLINFEKRRKEFEVIAQIKLLQSSCNNYCMTEDQKFIQWFRRQQYLTEEESYNLSRELEAAADATTTSPKSRKSMVKRFSLLFLGSEVVAHSTPIKEQPKSTPSGSSGESTDSASVSSCELNHSESEDICTTPVAAPDELQKKLSESSSCSSTHSTDTSSSGVSSLVSSPPLLSANAKSTNSDSANVTSAKSASSNSASTDSGSNSADADSANDKSAGAGSDSADADSAKSADADSAKSTDSDSADADSADDKSTNTDSNRVGSDSADDKSANSASSNNASADSDSADSGSDSADADSTDADSNRAGSDSAGSKSSVSATPITSKALPAVYNQQNKDMCIIRISTEDDNGNMYKSILLTSQDKTPAVIQRAMLKHHLECDAAEDYELVQVLSENKELVIPGNANVFYAMNSHANFDFILRKKASANGEVKMRSRCSLTLPRTAKWGCWSNRPSKTAM